MTPNNMEIKPYESSEMFDDNKTEVAADLSVLITDEHPCP